MNYRPLSSPSSSSTSPIIFRYSKGFLGFFLIHHTDGNAYMHQHIISFFCLQEPYGLPHAKYLPKIFFLFWRLHQAVWQMETSFLEMAKHIYLILKVYIYLFLISYAICPKLIDSIIGAQQLFMKNEVVFFPAFLQLSPPKNIFEKHLR